MQLNNKDIYLVIATNIKKYRIKNNLTQQELAKKSGYSYSYLRKIEGNNCPKYFSIQTVFNLAKALNIDIKELFKDNDIWYSMKLMNRLDNYLYDREYKIILKENYLNIVNYGEIIDFSLDKISVRKNNKNIIVTGKNLTINKMLDEELLITGIIQTISIN